MFVNNNNNNNNNNNSFAGVIASRSFESSVTGTKSRLLIICLASIMKVSRHSSVKVCSLTRAPNTLRTERIMSSHTPPQ
ncbi:unnamed protein product [Schistosoma curassoni]|uniref:Secreted protein n=1 Tax=Schistosoma curassoni TaxID=6186 RepID=A0A183L6C9_9TREM|nr:unnamed protein product [Schistosoma curassoni]